MKLTKLELEVMKAIDASEYGERLQDGVWTFTIADHLPKTVASRSIPGIVSSLVKKGFLTTGGSGRDQEVGITKDGQDAYVAAVGAANVRKFLK